MTLTVPQILAIEQYVRRAIREDRNEDAIQALIFCFQVPTTDEYRLLMVLEKIFSYFNRFRREEERSEFTEDDFNLSMDILASRLLKSEGN